MPAKSNGKQLSGTVEHDVPMSYRLHYIYKQGKRPITREGSNLLHGISSEPARHVQRHTGNLAPARHFHPEFR
jgi:hypothetical protein